MRILLSKWNIQSKIFQVHYLGHIFRLIYSGQNLKQLMNYWIYGYFFFLKKTSFPIGHLDTPCKKKNTPVYSLTFYLCSAVSTGWCCAPGSTTTLFWNRGRSLQPTRTRRSFAWRSCVHSLWRLCSRSSKNTPTPKVCSVCMCLFLIYWRVAVLVLKKMLIYTCGQRKRHVSVWRSWSHAPTTCLCRKFSEIIVSSFFF